MSVAAAVPARSASNGSAIASIKAEPFGHERQSGHEAFARLGGAPGS